MVGGTNSETNGTGGAAGPTAPGEHRRIRINHTRITPGCTRDASGRTRTHQDTSSITTDNTRTHRTTQDLKRQTEGEPSQPTEDYSQLETPATGKASPPAHTQLRIARTNETKRFPGCLTPQPPIQKIHNDFCFIYIIFVLCFSVFIYDRKIGLKYDAGL